MKLSDKLIRLQQEFRFDELSDRDAIEDGFNRCIEDARCLEIVEAELSKTNAGYLKARLEAAEQYLDSRSVQLMSEKQIKTYKKWLDLKNQPEPPSELSAKLDNVNNKILIVKGILAEKCGLRPDLYEELSALLDEILNRLK